MSIKKLITKRGLTMVQLIKEFGISLNEFDK